MLQKVILKPIRVMTHSQIKVLDQVTKRAKIEKSFKHIFSGDFAFVCMRGKPL